MKLDIAILDDLRGFASPFSFGRICLVYPSALLVVWEGVLTVQLSKPRYLHVHPQGVEDLEGLVDSVRNVLNLEK